ncbi:IS110 family RNA-guided transposase [Ferribacterium limneticum]|uniref:IS110 family transposase n=1 Tax=Ferribacterium limneticum TaxID=76259 RepID=UPI001CFA7331|nr:IS110 family transposase [Ferribacterium limneticum]UCV27864.1 IS110 family transposase [Ferribacterium limneticum]UCV31781.1 IS110 family transposase [Ferribacterium limneticum]
MKWLGIDIAKRKFDLAVLDNGKIRSKVFENTVTGHELLLAWLAARGYEIEELHACMEATSQYYEKLAVFLHDAGMRVSMVNPLQIKAFGESRLSRQKTDRADARLIAHFAEQQSPALWHPAPREIRELQRLLARLQAVQQMSVQEQNRAYEAEGEALESVSRTLVHLKAEEEKLRKLIRDHVDQNPHLSEQHALLTSIPGVGDQVSSHFMAWLRPERFDDARQAVAFVGLSPRHRQSGDSVRGKARLCKVGHARLRKILYFPAMSAMRYNPAAKAIAERLKASGKTGKVVIGAVMRKMIHWMFGVLKSGRPFDPKLALTK